MGNYNVAKQENNKKTDLRNSRNWEENRYQKESSSEKERKENALALWAEEGRDKLRKATGSCK